MYARMNAGYFEKNAEAKPYGLRYLFAFMAFAKGYSAMHLPYRNKKAVSRMVVAFRLQLK